MTRLEIYIMSRLNNLEWYISQKIDPVDTRCRASELKMLCEYGGVSEEVSNRAVRVYIKAAEAQLECD